MESVDLVFAVVAVAINLAAAAVLFAGSRGGTAVPRIFGRPQPFPRLRAVMHACLGLAIGLGWLVKDIFPPHSTGDSVLSNVIRILLAAGIVAALLAAFQYARPSRDKATR